MGSGRATEITNRQLAYALVVLLAINGLNFFDRQVLGAVAQPLKEDWQLSDTQLGVLATAFTLLYAVVGVPLGRWADWGSRRRILALGVLLWGLATALSGLAWSVASLFTFRLLVGVGEASCAPAATSLLGDLFPRDKRARATAIFMTGLPLGLSLSFIVGGFVAQRWGWRPAFVIAGLPGLILAFLALGLPEPSRHEVDQASGMSMSQIRHLLGMPTMWWIIISGAIHNFSLYALSTFLSPLLVRYYGLRTDQAGWVGGVAYGGFGGLGMLLGGWLSDRMIRRRTSGRLESAAAGALLAVGCLFVAGFTTGEQWLTFSSGVCLAILLLYSYYAAVYATILDLVAAPMRGTAMAIYFCAMYLLGAAVGGPAIGWISDFYARRAAAAEGFANPTPTQVAEGLHQALQILPWLTGVLALVLIIASISARHDYQRMGEE
jgi:predicted MFS family arabinose efflux permease